MKELYSPRLFLAAAALSFGIAANAHAMPAKSSSPNSR